MQSLGEKFGEHGEKIPKVAAKAASSSAGTGSSNLISASDPSKIVVPKVRQILIAAEQSAETLAAVRGKKEEIQDAITGAVQLAREIEGMHPDLQALNRSRFDEAWSVIKQCLNFPEPYRRAALLAFASSMLVTCRPDRRAVEETLGQLSVRGFLAQTEAKNGEVTPKGAMKVYGQVYFLSVDLAREPEAVAIFGRIQPLVEAAVRASQRNFEEDHRNLLDEAGVQLNSGELEAGKSGRLVLEIPDRRDGEKFYRGGFILVQAGEGKIRPLKAIGGPRAKVAEMVEAGIFLPANQIGNSRLELHGRVDRDRFALMLTLFHFLKDGFAILKKEEEQAAKKAAYNQQVAAEREALAAKATILADQFLNGRVGTAFIDFGRRPFLTKDADGRSVRVSDFFALVKRGRDKKVSVVEAPERLAGFFKGLDEPRDPGGNFNNFGRAGKLLRAVASQLRKEGEIDAE
jgi:hypothetical protein